MHDPQRNVDLAPLTTLELGGPAAHLVEATSQAEVVDALRWARGRGLPILVLGGGSNVVIGDDGFDGLVLRIATRGVRFAPAGPLVHATVAAGVPWDRFVAEVVARDVGGLECLSGIPGLAGATPIQNVGAYGQEVSDTLVEVQLWDRQDDVEVVLGPRQCGFAYRDSRFKRDPQRFVVLSVTFGLQPGARPELRYAELERALAGQAKTVARVRQTVLELRRGKSMVIDPDDPNRRSVGSFFTNPIVDAATATAVAQRARTAGLIADVAEMPQWPMPENRVKLAAGWLVERSGIAKGLRDGAVGVSSRHALALVHHGGGTTAALLDLARRVQADVKHRFGISLCPEPVFVGCSL